MFLLEKFKAGDYPIAYTVLVKRRTPSYQSKSSRGKRT
jgi:hypothetical protein